MANWCLIYGNINTDNIWLILRDQEKCKSSLLVNPQSSAAEAE